MECKVGEMLSHKIPHLLNQLMTYNAYIFSYANHPDLKSQEYKIGRQKGETVEFT